jgi:nicotinate phosphoribosyltransferase
MPALLTDLYQLTMAAGYFDGGKAAECATFEIFARRLPDHRNFLIAAGLAQAVDYLLNLSFDADEIEYLRGLPQFAQASPDFWDYLREFRFTGDLFAVPEGTPIFANEPIATVRGPMIEAQIPETYLLATFGFQTLIAAKAARVAYAAKGRDVAEFGTRRAHSPEAGVLAGRAAYIGGCSATSNTETGIRYGVPVAGTCAHSWVMSFAKEREAFASLQRLLGPKTIYLIDTYDTIEGARRAAALGPPLWGVRLDSGDFDTLARQVRKVLDEAGLQAAKIMATGDLNEYKIADLMASGAPIDAFGVGTELATSADAPNLGVVYKLVELEANGVKRYTAKTSETKATLPGGKQIFRYAGRDVVSLSTECPGCPEGAEAAKALLEPVILGGRLVARVPDVHEARRYAAACIEQLPAACHSLEVIQNCYTVEYSAELLAVRDRFRDELRGAE